MNLRPLALAPVLVCTPGCIVVGGYSSTGGWFVWPGGLMIFIVLVLLLVFMARGRRRRY